MPEMAASDRHTEHAEAGPERARWPRLAAAPHPRLRSLLPRGYVGFTEATIPRQLVLPATTAVPLVVKLADSPYRPPAFVMGAHGTSVVLEGDCAPSYLEVLLGPLGAYRLLGLPMNRLSGDTVDLVEVLGAGGRRLAEQLRDTPSWRQRFALMDRFLLERLDWGRVAAEVGYADQAHLVREFRQSTGTTRPGSWPGPAPPTAAVARARSIPFKTGPRSLPNMAGDKSSVRMPGAVASSSCA